MLFLILSLLGLGALGIAAGGDDDEMDVMPDEAIEPVNDPVDPAPDLNDPVMRDPVVSEESEEAEESDEVTDPVEEIEPAPDPQEAASLVFVASADGVPIADGDLLRPGGDTFFEEDRDFVLTGTADTADITVDYAADTTFRIIFDDETDTIRAALNSDIARDAIYVDTNTDIGVDDDGLSYVEETLTQSVNQGTQITLEVGAAQIGTHVAQVDLSDPADSLQLQFGGDVTGNLHLVTKEIETLQSGDTYVEGWAYVVATSEDVTELNDVDLFNATEFGGTEDQRITLIAEIYLGNDALYYEETPGGAQDYRVTIENLMNEARLISSNVAWTSETTDDAPRPVFEPVADDTADGAGDGGDTASGDDTGGGDTGSGGDTGGGLSTPTTPTIDDAVLQDLLDDPRYADALDDPDLLQAYLDLMGDTESGDVFELIDSLDTDPTLNVDTSNLFNGLW